MNSGENSVTTPGSFQPLGQAGLASLPGGWLPLPYSWTAPRQENSRPELVCWQLATDGRQLRFSARFAVELCDAFGASAAPPAAVEDITEAFTQAFTEGLWQGLVAECFLGREGEDAYTELNLAPDGRWWACRFTRYRERTLEQPCYVGTSQRWVEASGERCASLLLPIDLLGTAAESPAKLRLVATAIIPAGELLGERAEYLTSRQPPVGEPDFHLRELRRAVVLGE